MSDIIAITDSNKNIVAEYRYDLWGKVLDEDNLTTIGNLNPFRYRSYYYDSDIEMYYLQSRYYDAKVGRFINCDDVSYIGVSESEISYNPFAYCENNPVNCSDVTGCLKKHWWNNVEYVANIIDAILIVASLGKSYMSYRALIKFLKKNKNKVLYKVRGKIVQLFGWSVGSLLGGVIDVALTLFGNSIGKLIAKALDYCDSWFGYTRSNGYIFN